MTAKSWRALRDKKYQLSLRLFLFLNAMCALFSLLQPLYTAPSMTIPLCAIAVSSTGLLVWHWKFEQRKISMSLISILFGCLWAWHITIKYARLANNDTSYLIVALLGVLFIGTIAFSNNISAFALHSAPTILVCLWLSKGAYWSGMLYCFALPVVGITIQNIIQKRYDDFAQDLMYKLLEERETLSDLSMLDPLTGLYNRRGLQSRLDTLMALDTSKHFVLLLDIDHFKAYNDHYGHMMGDQALIRVSAAIRDAVRSRDIVTRYGGEEFMVILTNTDPIQARLAAERIRQRVYDLKIPHMFNQSVATNVTVSIGIASLAGVEMEGALEKADKALYEAKHLGRNNILASEDLTLA